MNSLKLHQTKFKQKQTNKNAQIKAKQKVISAALHHHFKQ